MKTKKKALLTVLCAAALVFGSVFGTYAYLTDKTEEVKNTFTIGNVDITLTETWNADDPEDEDNINDHWSALLMPGKNYAKDPVVTVTANSENCYLFVKFDKNNNTFKDGEVTKDVIVFESTLTADKGWTQGNGTDIPSNVWYRTVNKTDATKTWHLINGDTVQVNEDLTNGTMPTTNNTPELIYTAYAIQQEGFATPAAAWTAVKTAYSIA